MKRNKLFVLLLSLIMLLTACNFNSKPQIKEKDDGKINIVASFFPYWDLVNRIAADRVNLINLSQTGSAHGYEPSVEDMQNIVDADLIFINGVSFENWTDRVMKANPELKFIDLSKNIDLLEVSLLAEDFDEEIHDDKDDHQGHNHGLYDPHIWMSPVNAKIMLNDIRLALVEADPSNADFYEANYKIAITDFDSLINKYKNEFKDIQGKDIVVPHVAFGYLVRDLGIRQLGISGIHSENDPTLTRLVEITDIMQERGLSTVFYEYGKDPRMAEAIANEIGGQARPISTLEVITDLQLEVGDDYLSLMEMNISNILESFK